MDGDQRVTVRIRHGGVVGLVVRVIGVGARASVVAQG